MMRLLSMAERRIDSADRATYLAALGPRRASAASAQAHFWVFEHATEDGRFVEFTEAASANAISEACGHTAPDSLWREVQGA